MSAAEQRHYCPVCNAVFRTPFSRCPLDGNVLAELNGDPLVGTTLDGRYEVEECIGEGGMGRVYRAKHTRMSRNYAIKILFGDHAGDSRMRSRFAREAEAVSRLNHTNVISVVDFGETAGGLLYLVMDLAKGESLAELMIREAPLAPDRAVAILAQLAKGLAHAHAQGLVHRDFKGENVIMVREEDREVPKIVDFGICMITEDSPSSTMLTSNGMVMGTPAVMAPEQASGDKVDHRTDLFSLGIVGYQMLSGKLPFEGTPLDMARKNLYEAIPTIMERCGIAVAPALEAIIHKLTAKQPNDRYQDAKSALADMQNLGMGWVESSTDWNAPTPLPAPVPTPVAAHVASQGNFSTISTNSGPDRLRGFSNQRSTPMTTEAVGTPGFYQMPAQRSRRTPVIVGAVAIVLITAAAIGVSGRGDNATKTAAALEVGPGPSNLEATGEGAATAVETTPATGPETSPTDATTTTTDGIAPPDITHTDGVEPTTEKTQPETTPATKPETSSQQDDKKNSGKRKNTNRKHKDRIQKPAIQNTTPPEITSTSVRRLYTSVGDALNKLESAQGKAAVAAIRHDYNAISYSKISYDTSILPVYQQSLLRLRRKINAARKK